MKTRAFVVILLVCGVAGGAYGADSDTEMRVDFGWGGAIRAQKWVPIFVTVTDPQPRQCVLELYSPHDSTYSMRVRQGFTIGPSAATFALIAPLNSNFDSTSITLRDARTGDWLASELLEDPQSYQSRDYVQLSQILIGISGRSTTQQMLQGQLREGMVHPAYLDPARLPVAAAGYDSLDVLLLNAPDLNRMTAEQQEAIVAWVRAGGKMLLWPSEDALPASGAILSILPCLIGENRAIELSAAQVQQLGLLPRFTKLGARELSPVGADVEPIKFLPDGKPTGFRHRVGFGEVAVLPADLSLLQFAQQASVSGFWNPILKTMVALPEKTDPQNPQNANNNAWQIQQQRQQQRTFAMQQNMDLLGTIPGVGSFGFGYVATVMIAMILLVGPIDFLILKKMRRQPWTWFTTGAWIALITAGAVFAGHIFKSGDLHFRTLRVIDQADGMAAATTDLVCIYSPRTTDYDVKGKPETWWQPASSDYYGSYGGGRLRTDVRFNQDYRGNTPASMWINVWNLRFIEGETIEPGMPVIDASLSVAGNRVTGTVTNRSDQPIKDLRVRHQKGVSTVRAEALAPGATANIDALLSESDTTFTVQTSGYHGPYYDNHGTVQNAALSYRAAGDLADRRSRQLDAMLKARMDLACVYAECVDPPAAVELEQIPAFQQHWRIVRALVDLK